MRAETREDLRDKTQAACRATRPKETNRRNQETNRRNEDTTFVNPDIDYDIGDPEDYEQRLSFGAEGTRRIRQNDLCERPGDESRSSNARKANITLGIREFSAMSTAKAPKGRNCDILSNRCVMVCIVLLLLAALVPAGYVYYDYDLRKDRSCVSNTRILGSQANLTTKKELRELSNKMHTLQNELKELKSASSKSQPGPGNSRQDRRLFAQLTRKADGIEKDVKDITKNLNDKILTMDKHCNDSITQLNSELSNMKEFLKHNRSILGKCVFKMHSVASDRKQNQTVSIIERKSDDFTLTMVTCCTEITGTNLGHYNAFLTVEINNKTTSSYTCHCFNRQKCDICYWECRDQ